MKIGPKGALGSHEICPIHSAPSLGQSIPTAYSGITSQSPLNLGIDSFLVISSLAIIKIHLFALTSFLQ